jgi:hypothetical protein
MFDFGQLLSSFGGGMQAMSAYSQAKNQQAALLAQSQVALDNAELSGWASQDAVRRGEDAANQVKLRGAQVKGQQRAAMATNNVDLAVGSAQNILNDTDYISAVDASTLQTNAAREAWGYDVQAKQYRQQAGASRAAAGEISPWLAAGTSLLGTATRVASRWYTNTPAEPAGNDDAIGGLIRRRGF